ncbi:winged helix-turn-helix domain-containing protein [Shewanella khirikhana]|nr:winged helix-turn-helix domain-containing protein [Shewanella khirikhana]
MDMEIHQRSSAEQTPGTLHSNRRIQFDEFEFVTSPPALYYRQQRLPLEPKMLQLMTMLIDARPELVSKDALMSALWPDTIVSDWSLARLVSDTRKLLDSTGSRQPLIKTVRGRGFCFVPDAHEIIDVSSQFGSRTIDNSALTPADTLAGSRSNRFIWIFSLLLFITAIVGVRYLTSPTEQLAPSQSLHDSAKHRLDIMLSLQRSLKLTKTAFEAQVRRRNELAEAIATKQPELMSLGWEQRLRQYQPQSTADEKFIFEQIRAFTSGPLLKGNRELLTLLDNHPELYEEIDSFLQLHSHLQIWLNKYDQVFRHHPEMAVLYIGVEDGVPFPTEIDKQVEDWINARQTYTTE